LNKLANLQTLALPAAVKLLVPGENAGLEEDFHADEVGLSNRQGRLIQLSAWLDLDNKVSISCAGAVIAWLQRKRASEYLQDDPTAQQAYRITQVEMFSIKNTM
jgi:DNA mismatch repair protein MSH5